MKKIKLLPLLLIVPMLSGCGDKPSKPSFAKVGEEVSAKEFTEAFQKELNKASFMNEKLLDSGIFKSDARGLNINEGKKNGSKPRAEIRENEKLEVKYDKENVLMEQAYDGGSSMVLKSDESNMLESSEANQTMFFQKAKENKKDYLVVAIKEDKEYDKVAALSKTVTAQKLLDTMMKASIAQAGQHIMSVVSEYPSMDEEEQETYRFYKNGSIYTIEHEEELSDSKSKDGKLVYVGEGKTEEKIQIDLTEGKLKAAYWFNQEARIDYKRDDEGFKKGDYIITKAQASHVASFVAKKVTLKAQDLSNYVRLGLDW